MKLENISFPVVFVSCFFGEYLSYKRLHSTFFVSRCNDNNGMQSNTRVLFSNNSNNNNNNIQLLVPLEGRQKQCYSYVSPEDTVGLIGL